MIKMFVLAAALLSLGAVSASAQVSASETTTGTAAKPAPSEYEWYPVSGTLTLQTQGKTYAFKSLKMRKIDGIKVELKGASLEPAAEFLFTINTLEEQGLFRPGLSYVSEGNLEHGETFLMSLDLVSPAASLLSKEAGGVMKILSVRGGTIKMEIKGNFEDASGSPYIASLDLIDARYGR